MNVITALGDEKINILLRDKKDINIIGFDIQYQDGIFEILEKNKNIDFLILNINLIGELNYKELIEKIKEKNNKFNLIVFFERDNAEIKKYLIENNIEFIFTKNNLNLENIISILYYKKIIINDKNNKKILKKIFNNKNVLIKFLKSNKIKTIINKLSWNILIKNTSIKKILNKKVNFLNCKKLINKLNLKDNYKIKIFLNIKITNKTNKIKTNKNINLIKFKNDNLNSNDLLEEILEIIKEEIIYGNFK